MSFADPPPRKAEFSKYRKHHDVPWIESPLVGADEEELVFHQRHEANTVELFFDLFFVANLATFTAYHSITDHSALLGYIGFFAIIWCSWFQVTLHDVRFARDSVYERMCKLLQMIIFVGFALVGSKFDPTTKEATDNTVCASNSKGRCAWLIQMQNFRILCYVLLLSRIQLAVQYTVVLFFSLHKGYRRLLLPLGLNVAVFAVAAIAFGAMTPAFSAKQSNHQTVYAVWWVVMLLEVGCTIAISSIWRMLSFKATHLVERMGLLTLIVIGEGAIGVTKTVSKLMGKSGLDPEGSGQIICILLILLFLWMLYFDNHPHGHYGTIRQQVWSTLHFPLHLAIVGVVEGAQQIAQARYVIKNIETLTDKLISYCVTQNLDGSKLESKLNDTIKYFQFDKKLETIQYVDILQSDIFDITRTSLYKGVCSKQNTTNSALEDGFGLPHAFDSMITDAWSAFYAGLGIKFKTADFDKVAAVIAYESWKIVYIYWWAAIAVVLLVFMVMLYLVRKNKMDFFDWSAQTVRTVMLAACIALCALASNSDVLYGALSSTYLLPAAVIIFGVINLVDKLSRQVANWRLKRKNLPYSDDHAAEHGEHGGAHGGAHGHKASASHVSTHSRDDADSIALAEGVPLTHQSTEYAPVPLQNVQSNTSGYAGYSPPVHQQQVYQSPPMQTHQAGYFGGQGYAPVAQQGAERYS